MTAELHMQKHHKSSQDPFFHPRQLLDPTATIKSPKGTVYHHPKIDHVAKYIKIFLK